MQTYLTNYALNNVWCNYEGENHQVFKPERVSLYNGSLNTVMMLDRELPLPIRNVRTHVFQIGQYTPGLLGLLERWPTWAYEKWYTVKDSMNALPVYVNVYDEKGCNIPRDNAYLMMTKEKCLVLAVVEDWRVKADYSDSAIYMRVYSNQYLRDEFRETNNPLISAFTAIPEDHEAKMEVLRTYQVTKLQGGHTEMFINGFYVENPTYQSMGRSDHVEIIHDQSVKRVVKWKVKDLLPFTSTLDKKFKYILHYSKDVPVDSAEFFGDCDVHIMMKTPSGETRGYYYHKNLPDAMRMLTHRDYSLCGEYVTYTANRLASDLGLTATDLLECEVQLKIRRNCFNRELIKDNNRIFEMYKLSDQRILMSMTGTDSLVPEWHAAYLEASAYARLMGARYHDVTPHMTEDALGYNTISQILGNTPGKPDEYHRVPLAYGLSKNSTAFEFDANGTLLGYYRHTSNDDDYNCRNLNAKLVEVLVGEGTHRHDVQYGYTNIPVAEDADFRVYHRHRDMSPEPVDPPLPHVWTDITGDTSLYEFRDGKVVWIAPDTDQELMVKTNSNFLLYTATVTPNIGAIILEISEVTEYNGETKSRTCPIPGGDLQIWLNGRNLVRDIDYVVNFPYVSINNFTAVLQPPNQPQVVVVRMTGFCTKDLQLPELIGKGFVINGALSDNRSYDIHEDKVMHISVNGGLIAPEDVNFFEDSPEWDRFSPMNGSPYQIKDIVVPLRNYTPSGTYPLLEKAIAIDEHVENYMNIYYPKPVDPPISTATNRYRVTSPFIAHMVELCLTNRIVFEPWITPSDEEVLRICKPYEGLLDYDPIMPEHKLPSAYVVITPTRYRNSVNVTRAQYRFLESVVRLYGNGIVSLTNFITFTI